MLEVVVEVDGRPLSSFGCDGIVMSTPTGSTAYAFSAGGPVVWPSVDALLMVPLSAHALFARPLVISPSSLLAVEVLQRSAGAGVLWCDGRRSTELPAGAMVEVRKSDKPVRLARLHQGPFTDRLVKVCPDTAFRRICRLNPVRLIARISLRLTPAVQLSDPKPQAEVT